MTAGEVQRLLALPPARRFYSPIRRTATGWVCRRVDLVPAVATGEERTA
ncbi:MAG: hypothetical protein ACHREM_05050 [Polyangiales bacterium]